jgi:hypothetical protein
LESDARANILPKPFARLLPHPMVNVLELSIVKQIRAVKDWKTKIIFLQAPQRGSSYALRVTVPKPNFSTFKCRHLTPESINRLNGRFGLKQKYMNSHAGLPIELVAGYNSNFRTRRIV